MSRRALLFAPAPAAALAKDLPDPVSSLVPLLQSVGYYILDPRFAAHAAVCRPHAVANAPVTAPVHPAAELLHKLRLNADVGLIGLQASLWELVQTLPKIALLNAARHHNSQRVKPAGCLQTCAPA